MYDELEGNGEEEFMTCIEVLSWHLSGMNTSRQLFSD
jgi:hypothetical protein